MERCGGSRREGFQVIEMARLVRFGDDGCGLGGSCEEVTELAGLTGLAGRGASQLGDVDHEA